MADAAAHREVAFGDALRLFVKNYAVFEGRSSRGAWWWWLLVYCLALCATGTIDYALFGRAPEGVAVFSTLLSLAVLVPNIALAARRLHDIGKSAQWLFVALIPIAGLIWLGILFSEPGQRSENQYGSDVEAGR